MRHGSTRRRLGHGLTLALLSLLAATAVRAQAGAEPRRPGRLVDVGGWRLHLNCTGSKQRGRPTVVLESGSGDFSFDWSLVQADVSRFARVCSYDRAGHGWSELGPRPRTLGQLAYELRTVLSKGGERAPYVLVGHSFGGLIVRTFAGLYPSEVAGLVLVDSTHEDTQLFINGQVKRVREMSQGRTVPPVSASIRPADRALSAEQRRQTEDFLKQTGPPRVEPPFDRLPAGARRARLWALSKPEHYAADEDPFWGEEFAEIYAARRPGSHPLGSVPLFVLTRGRSEYPEDEQGRRLDAERRRMQADLLTLSTDSVQVVAANSGHHIQLDEPGLVVEAVRRALDKAARPARPRPER